MSLFDPIVFSTLYYIKASHCSNVWICHKKKPHKDQYCFPIQLDISFPHFFFIFFLFLSLHVLSYQHWVLIIYQCLHSKPVIHGNDKLQNTKSALISTNVIDKVKSIWLVTLFTLNKRNTCILEPRS